MTDTIEFLIQSSESRESGREERRDANFGDDVPINFNLPQDAINKRTRQLIYTLSHLFENVGFAFGNEP